MPGACPGSHPGVAPAEFARIGPRHENFRLPAPISYSMDPEAVQLTDSQRAALELLAGAQRILLTGHEAPDGDCVGSQAALARVLRSMGKLVWVLNPDPVDDKYAFLSEPCDMRAFRGADLPVHDVVCLLDASELGRTGPLTEPLARARSKKLVIDHHIPPAEPWWDAAFSDVTAAATGLLVWRIAAVLGAELDEVACEGLFTSIVTDTGWFRYANTDAETLAVSSELTARGVEPNVLYNRIFQRRRASYPRHVSALLGRAAYHVDGRLAVVDVPLEGGSRERHEMDDVIDVLSSVDSVEVILLLREAADGTCRLSARSKTSYDVSALAREFGGGGHAKASGARVPGALGEVHTKLVTAATRGLEATA